MHKPINVKVVRAHWHDWDGLLNLIEETEEMARKSIEALPNDIELDWTVVGVDINTVCLTVEYKSKSKSSQPADFKLVLSCKGLEGGTLVSLNGNALSQTKYQGAITAALHDVLVEAAAVAV